MPLHLDLDKLLQPIPGDQPAGADLRKDQSPSSVYRTIKDACSMARTAERKLLDGDTSANPDWSPVLKLAPEALASKTKDLEMAAWLIEALVRKEGFSGLKEGLQLARGLVDKFWDGLFPLPSEDEGMATRVSAFGSLNGFEADGLLIGPINKVPLTGEDDDGRLFARWHYRQAESLQALKGDPVKLQKRIEAGSVTQEMISRAESKTSAETGKKLFDDLSACLSEYDGLVVLLEEKCGKDREGHSAAPPSTNIRKALEECHQIVAAYAGPPSATGNDGAKTAGENASGPAGGGAPMSGSIRSRLEAFQVLLKVAQFFKQTEPHSPVSYALERIVHWGKLSLPELLMELISDEGMRSSVYKLVGIVPEAPPPSSPSS